MTNREIDALIAEHVMGLKVTNNCYAAPMYVDYGIGEGGFDGPLLHYSTDIAAAWEVVEKFSSCSIEVFECQDGIHRCVVTEMDLNDRDEVRADSAPMAICLAALRAKGIEVSEGE